MGTIALKNVAAMLAVQLSLSLQAQTFSVAAILQDSMVIQQAKPFRVWGKGINGSKVTLRASWSGQPVSVVCGQGKWDAVVPVPPVRPGDFTTHHLKITSDEHEIILNHLLLGEVWLCSGQSNMHMYMQPFLPWHNGAENYATEIPAADFPYIRLLTVEKDTASTPGEMIKGAWKACSPASVATFSIVGYYFGRALFRQLNVPVGIISAAYGGAHAQAFTPRKVLAGDTLLNRTYLEPFNQSGNTSAIAARPALLYNAMIHPLKNLSIKGFLWYQGESNASVRGLYCQLSTAMIKGWREEFAQAELPFYFVQLPPYNWKRSAPLENHYALFREEQAAVTMLPNTGMVCTMDLGDSTTIHSSRKMQIGERLARLALRKTYGYKHILYEGPVYESFRVVGDSVFVSYEKQSIAKGLMLQQGTEPLHFWISAKNKIFYPAKAIIVNNQVHLHSEWVKKPVAVRYAFTNYPFTNLANSDSIPAFPFRTDSWRDAELRLWDGPLVIRLYPDAVPNAAKYKIREEIIWRNDSLRSFRKVSDPLLYVYRPEKRLANGTAVIIFPGGGYKSVNIVAEGFVPAEELIKKGITAIVLKYRLPDDSIMRNKSIGPMQDAQQAIKTVRQNALSWGLDINKIGIMGFSAGGHLAATAATHFEQPFIALSEGTSLRPDFVVLIYPVISFSEPILHKPSRTALIGDHPSPEAITYYSIERNVTNNNPPTWITHAGDDRIVPVANSMRLYEALLKHNVDTELHLYAKGGHGFVLRQPVEQWLQPIIRWMRDRGWIY